MTHATAVRMPMQDCRPASKTVLTFCGDGNKTLRAGRRTGLRMVVAAPCLTGLSWADEGDAAEGGLVAPSGLCRGAPSACLHVHTACLSHTMQAWFVGEPKQGPIHSKSGRLLVSPVGITNLLDVYQAHRSEHRLICTYSVLSLCVSVQAGGNCCDLSQPKKRQVETDHRCCLLLELTPIVVVRCMLPNCPV